MKFEINTSHNTQSHKHTVIPGTGVTSEPVAMTMFFVLIEDFSPEGPSTATSFGPTIVPFPLTYLTPYLFHYYVDLRLFYVLLSLFAYFLNNDSTPEVRPSTLFCLILIKFGTSTETSPETKIQINQNKVRTK